MRANPERFPKPPRSRRRGKRLAVTAVLSVALCLAGGTILRAEEEVNPVKQTRSMLTRWVELQKSIAKAKADLDLSKQMLEKRIGVVRAEVERLREGTAEIRRGIEEAEKRRDELVKENEKLKEATAGAEKRISSLEARSLAMLASMPEHVQKAVERFSQEIPTTAKQAEKLKLDVRFQNVVGVLTQLNKSNREITIIEERRELPDGTAARVTALYVGLGQAYYVGTNGSIAGVGRPGEDGWVWTPRNEIADKVALAIAIRRGEEPAAFVRLPVTVTSQESEPK